MGFISVVPPYTLIVSIDRYPVNPRGLECFGRLICFYPGNALGDRHTYDDYNAFLKDIIPGGADPGLERMNTTALLHAAELNNVLMPVYLKEGAGICVSAMPVWSYDSLFALENRQIGWIYVSHDRIKQEFSTGSITPELIENAKILLYGEVDYYNNYLRGECFRFDLYKGGKPIANYRGMLGSLEDVKKEIEDLIPDECRGITDKMRCVEPGSGFFFIPESERFVPSYNESAPPIFQPSVAGASGIENNHSNKTVTVDADVFPINDPTGVTLAVVNIVIDNNIAINGITIEGHPNDLAVVMPKAKDINGRTFNVCAVISKELRALINSTVIDAYKSKIPEQAVV